MTLPNTEETKTMKHLIVPGAALVVATLAIAVAPAAHADGSPSYLHEYCDAKNRTGFGRELAPRWTAKYNRSERYWECHEARAMGPRMSGGRVKYFEPGWACQWKYGNSTVHSHEGANHSNPATVHCGISNGMRPAY